MILPALTLTLTAYGSYNTLIVPVLDAGDVR